MCTRLPARSTWSLAPVVPAIPAPTPATAHLPPEHGLRQPRYPQLGRDCASFLSSESRDSVPRSPQPLLVDPQSLFGRQALDLKAPDGLGVCAFALIRPLGLPWEHLEAASLGSLSVPRVPDISPYAVHPLSAPSCLFGPLSFAGPLGIPHLALDSSRGVVGGSL